MIYRILDHNSAAIHFINELRDEGVQQDSMRFRKNLQRMGTILGYELSKTLDFETVQINTQLGVAESRVLSDEVVLTGILRAGLPMHQGLLEVFDGAQSAFVSAYRKHHKDGTFEIALQYITCPPLDDKVLILTDAMLATGASIQATLEALLRYGRPKSVHVIAAIASTDGVEFIQRMYPKVDIWVGAEDEELTGKFYIVPGLGDAGDLAFGPKLQD